MKIVTFFISLFLILSCAKKPIVNNSKDFLSESISKPFFENNHDIVSRYWSYGPFLVHFLSQIKTQNKIQKSDQMTNQSIEDEKSWTPILFIHGLGGSVDDYSELIRLHLLSNRPNPVYALDLPPFGKSLASSLDISIRIYSGLIKKFISELNSKKIILVCHSMGGQVCIDYALENPDQIQLLTLISPAGVYQKSEYVNHTLHDFLGINYGSTNSHFGSSFGDMMWLDQGLTKKFISDNPVSLIALESYKNNYHNLVSQLKTKTLIFWGRLDRVFHYENGLFLKENILNSKLYVIDDADHFPLKTHAKFIISKIYLDL